MIIKAKYDHFVVLRKLDATDLNNLFDYLQNLSDETKARFGPHKFDQQSIINFYNTDKNIGYVAFKEDTNELMAYSVLKIGYLEHDCFRLESYGLTLSHNRDGTFAPSVKEAWQSCGIGNNLFQFILSDIANMKLDRLILWGGVQCTNEKAVNFYKKNGFKTLGQFTYNGENYDMIFDIANNK